MEILYSLILAIATALTDRHYYIMAEEVEWDYAPSYPHNPLTGEDFDADANVFLAPSERDGFIGRKYIKALYFEYIDDTFSTRKDRPSSEEHLGFMGPVIRAEVGDTIYVTFKNSGTNPYTMYPHGLQYQKSSEGAVYSDGTVGRDLDDVVQPGETYMYTWIASEESGPIPGSGMSSTNWWYHSFNDPVSEMAAGLLGPIVICQKGMCDEDGKPTDVDEEVFTMFMVMDENASILQQVNVNRYLGGADISDDEMEDYEESNLMHAMNGYLYGNLGTNVPIEITKGNLVRWYLLAVGNEVDLHTAHWHGNTVVSADGIRSDVERLLPGAMITVDMIPEMIGKWLWHCHVADHVGAGMMGFYTVVDCGNDCKTGDEVRTFPRLSAAGFAIDGADDHKDLVLPFVALGVALIALVGLLVLCVLHCEGKKSISKEPSVQMEKAKPLDV